MIRLLLRLSALFSLTVLLNAGEAQAQCPNNNTPYVDLSTSGAGDFQSTADICGLESTVHTANRNGGPVAGCTDVLATNFDPGAALDAASFLFVPRGATECLTSTSLTLLAAKRRVSA